MDHDLVLLLCMSALGIASSSVGGYLIAVLTAKAWLRLRGIK